MSGTARVAVVCVICVVGLSLSVGCIATNRELFECEDELLHSNFGIFPDR